MAGRSLDELREASDTVLYEIQMLFGVEHELQVQTLAEHPQPLPWAREMALIEAFALHARALIEFLWRSRSEKHPPRNSDIVAEDFFDPGDWRRLCPPQEVTLDNLARRVGREVVHLTYHRQQLTDEARQWSFSQVAAAIGRPLREFIRHVPPDRVEGAFKSQAWAAMPAHLRGPSAISFPPTTWPGPVATRMDDRP